MVFGRSIVLVTKAAKIYKLVLLVSMLSTQVVESKTVLYFEFQDRNKTLLILQRGMTD